MRWSNLLKDIFKKSVIKSQHFQPQEHKHIFYTKTPDPESLSEDLSLIYFL